MLTPAPYGTWPSSITPERLVGDSVKLSSVACDGDTVYWLESRSDNNGRPALVRRTADGSTQPVVPPSFALMTGVHEYGGGAYGVRDGVVVFSNFPDAQLWRIGPGDDEPVAITPVSSSARAGRYADIQVYPDLGVVLAVREDHLTTRREPLNEIVEIPLYGDDPDPGTVIASASDFVSGPVLSPDRSRLAWVAWDHPHMPWDNSRVHVAAYQPGALSIEPVTVAGGDDEAAGQPRWLPDGGLVFVSDRTGWSNLYLFNDNRCNGETVPLHPMDAEFAAPQWSLGMASYAILDRHTIACHWSAAGTARVGVLDIDTHELRDLGLVIADAAHLGAGDGQIAAVLAYHDRPAAVTSIDPTDGHAMDLQTAGPAPSTPVSRAQPVKWTTTDEDLCHGYFYAPTGERHTGTPADLPPLIVIAHGGPTAAALPAYSVHTQFWTSRGFALLDVNYRGSSGYGRAYREKLRGNWGLVDVADCESGALSFADSGRVDRRRMAIRGSSAGGYTVLRALSTTDTFAAGASHFGVADLELLAKDTHKFESSYLDGLIGPYPDAAATFRERSPLYQAAEITVPILLLQGLDDNVVPPNQAHEMVRAVEERGGTIKLVEFMGEGHGFRFASSIKRTYETELAFYREVFDL